MPAPPLSSDVERRVIILVALVQLVNVLDFVMVLPLGQDFARALDIDEARLGGSAAATPRRPRSRD